MRPWIIEIWTSIDTDFFNGHILSDFLQTVLYGNDLEVLCFFCAFTVLFLITACVKSLCRRPRSVLLIPTTGSNIHTIGAAELIQVRMWIQNLIWKCMWLIISNWYYSAIDKRWNCRAGRECSDWWGSRTAATLPYCHNVTRIFQR